MISEQRKLYLQNYYQTHKEEYKLASRKSRKRFSPNDINPLIKARRRLEAVGKF